MAWSRSKDYNQKWYRIKAYQNGDKDILEAKDQWSLEKGLGDDWDYYFDHFFRRDNHWFIQTKIHYKYLFVEPNERSFYGYDIRELGDSEYLDELFTHLQPIQEWMLFLEERVSDCEMAMEWQEAQIVKHQAQIKFLSNKPNENHHQEINHHQERIFQHIQKIREENLELDALLDQLLNEEGVKWQRTCSHITSRWCGQNVDNL